MASEIERKFLVCADAWRSLATPVLFRQGYLSLDKDRTVRVRIAGERAWLTVKGLTKGISRNEFEYEIPLADASQMLDEMAVGGVSAKFRYTFKYDLNTWEIDEFLEDNLGLIVAEIELEYQDQIIQLPPWIGEEVSGDSRYFNSNLIRNPYKNWKN